MDVTQCVRCQSPYVYQDGESFICPECAHEWPMGQIDSFTRLSAKDAYGTELVDGDAITIIKDLKLKGSGGNLKIGTKIKNITIIEGDHNISCRTTQFGTIYLKSEFVKKTS